MELDFFLNYIKYICIVEQEIKMYIRKQCKYILLKIKIVVSLCKFIVHGTAAHNGIPTQAYTVPWERSFDVSTPSFLLLSCC